MPDQPEQSPPQPITELAAGAIQFHELYRAYVDAGFTEAQAMQIIIALLLRPTS